MKEDAVYQSAAWSEARVVRVFEKTLVDNMKTVNTDHDKSLLLGAFGRATREMMMTLVNNDSVREAFKSITI